MNRRALAIALVVLALIGSALGAPRKRGKRPRGKRVPAAGSAGSAGSAGASAGSAGSSAAPRPDAPPPPDAGSAAVVPPSPSPGPSPARPPAPPVSSPAPVSMPVLAPPSSVTPRGTMTMRPKRAEAHGGLIADMDCSNCHTTAGWALAATAGASGFDHDRTGFPLRGSHAQGTCAACHTGGRKPATMCEGCHADPHEGRHDETCAECHTATAWTDVNALEQHRRTRMPLTGKHAVIDCVACHRRQGGRTFSDVPADCYACHRDRFNDPTTHPNHNGTAGGPVFPRDCGQCHQTTAWSPAIANPDLLPREAIARTGGHDPMFLLSTGSHRTASCESCHTDPRRAAIVRCDGCHEDTAVRRQHGGAPQPRAAVSCLRCHPRGAAR